MPKVFVAQHHAEAHFVCGVLQTHGFTAEVRGESLFTTIGGSSVIPGAAPEVWVAESAQVDRALELVRRFVHGEAGPEGVGPAWTCAACGETHEAQFTACWNCGATRPEASRT